jgi:hypothetical protein
MHITNVPSRVHGMALCSYTLWYDILLWLWEDNEFEILYLLFVWFQFSICYLIIESDFFRLLYTILSIVAVWSLTWLIPSVSSKTYWLIDSGAMYRFSVFVYTTNTKWLYGNFVFKRLIVYFIFLCFSCFTLHACLVVSCFCIEIVSLCEKCEGKFLNQK